MSETGRAAVFSGVGLPLAMTEYPLPEVEPGALLVRITMCTVCGSDVHTWSGHRPGAVPAILGHEISGRIVKLGSGVTHDLLGREVKPGDRIIWAMYASCGTCYFCRVAGLPQKCVHLHKYGHERSDQGPHWNGGFAEYVYLRPGTVILKVPDELSDEEVTPINCATATVASGLDAIGIHPGDTVVVQGVGMLGMCACAMAVDRGARQVIALDLEPKRLDIAKRFGATHTIAVKDLPAAEVGERIRALTHGRGADVAVEVTGHPLSVTYGIEALRTGGRYVLLGMVSPGALAEIDWWRIIYKSLTIKGVHNYDARHLLQALDFVTRTRDRFPFRELVTHKVPLAETEKALELSKQRVGIRIAVVP